MKGGRKPHPALVFARQQGHTTYFTGLPCARGHVAGRFTKGHACIECKRLDREKLTWNAARLAAKAAGQRFYTAERPCQRGHDPVRYVSIDQCRACVKMHGTERAPAKIRKVRERYAVDSIYRERENRARKQYTEADTREAATYVEQFKQLPPDQGRVLARKIVHAKNGRQLEFANTDLGVWLVKYLEDQE